MIRKSFLLGICCAVFAIHLAQAQTSFAPLAQKVMPSAVNISTRLQDAENDPNVENDLLFKSADGRIALGSGFVVSKEGHIATNRHVIEKSSRISVITSDGKAYEAKVAGMDYKTDLALIKIEPEQELQPVVFGDSDLSQIGDWVLAVGNPFGLGSSVTAGIISAKSRDIGDGFYDDYLQTDAAINQGNSGGPMFNMQGELIGINTAIFANNLLSGTVGFALPSNQAKWVIDQLRKNGKVERSHLGLTVKAGQTADHKAGLTIISVDDEKADASLLPGDVILELNGRETLSVRDFSQQVAQIKPKTEISLKVWRNGSVFGVKIVTKKMSDDNIALKQAAASDSASGTNFPAFGMSVDHLTVTAVYPSGEAELKGIRVGDRIVKIENSAAQDMQNLIYYAKDAVLSCKNLRLNLKDKDGETYFVDLAPQETPHDQN